jgi:CDP-paratose synthetase
MSGKIKVLITGGTGYIGSNLVKKMLINNNLDITLVVRDINSAKELFMDSVNYIECGDLKIFIYDIEKLLPNIVIHLAAYSTSSDMPNEIRRLIESNIIFTSNLLIALSNIKIDLFINTGSFSEYHYNNNLISPTYFYSTTKSSARYMIEYFSKKNSFNFINMILYTVYGKKSKNKKIIDYVIESLDSKESIAMSDGKQILDFVHIDDVVNFFYTIIVNNKNIKNSRIDYFIGTGQCFSIRELVIKIENITSKKANIAWGKNKSRKIDTIKACASIESVTKELNYEIKILLDEGLKKYIGSKE